jgi:hypothetical protein
MEPRLWVAVGDGGDDICEIRLRIRKRLTVAAGIWGGRDWL